MKPHEPQPVKLIIGFLYHELRQFRIAQGLLEEHFGNVDYQSKEYFFDMTDYYDEELGKPVFRVFCSYERLINPSELGDIKLFTNQLEVELAATNKRKVNLDPGYLDYHKLVLASAKYNYQKIYLHSGIYADPTLFYEKGRFTAPEWAFPDFKSSAYIDDFLHIRFLYKQQLKNRTNRNEI